MMKKNLVSLSSKIAQNAHKLVINELEKQGVKGIVPSHGSILHLLYAKESVTMKEIADFIHKTKPTVTVLINKLEKLGFVYRQKSELDSRIVYIKLTQKGEELKPIFDDVSNILNEKVYKDLSKEESQTVERILQKVLNNLS